MKKTLITAFCMLIVFIAVSRDGRQPPKHVRDAFQKEYPNSKSGVWNHSGTNWSVNFEDKDHNYGEVTAHFDSRGRHIDTNIPYDNNDVPAPVIDKVKHGYPTYNDYDVTRIDRSGENSVYKVNLRSKSTNRTLYLDEKGEKKSYHAGH
jgi:hypothetical protein